jgi:UDP-glucuronate 4-epimerase
MPILVTGAAGFIGSHLCERLIERGHAVVGVDAFIPYYPRAIKEGNLSRLRDEPRFRFIEADLRSDDLTSIVDEADIVLHLAAMPGAASWQQFDLYVACNLLATQRLLEAFIRAGRSDRARFVQVSTSSVYGVEALGAEDVVPHPANPYGITKLAAEQLVFAYAQTFGIDAIALRYFSIYGPRQRPDMAYHTFIEALLHDQPVRIFGDGTQTRGNTYIDDCVTGTLQAMEHGQTGEAYNLGGGIAISINDVIAELEEIIGREARREYLPGRLGDQRHTLADIRKAQAHFGYAPVVQPREGLRRQVEWQRTKAQ